VTDLHRKRVLVTGGSGFLGRHLVHALEVRGYKEVIAPPRSRYDLTIARDVERLYADTCPQVVIHLAAIVGGIGANSQNPGRFFYDNLIMGVMVMEHARRTGVEKFVGIGTVCAYPEFTPVPFREDDIWSGYPEETNAPYGLAKKMLLVQGQAYRQQYGFNAIHLVPVNLYGPGDNFDLNSSHVIPALIRKCLDAAERKDPQVVCWGDGSATREFLYVEDCAEAIALATERFDGYEPVNIGTGIEVSIKELVGLIAEQTGFGGAIAWDTSRPNGQPRRCLDTQRAWDRFGFRARTDFREGLRRTVEWYRRNRER
jgi:GDP-L-fucose synthase